MLEILQQELSGTALHSLIAWSINSFQGPIRFGNLVTGKLHCLKGQHE